MKQETIKNILSYKQVGNKRSNYTLVFLHGATMTKEGMLPLAERFEDYNCIVFDLTAHGASKGKEPGKIEEFAIDVEKSIMELKKERKISERIILMGYSMGGAITCEIAIRKKIRLKGIVLLSSGANLDQYTPLVDSLKKVPKETFHTADIFDYLFGEDTKGEEKKKILDILNTTRTSDKISYDDLMVANQYNRIDELKKVRLPAMIVHGNDDKIILPMSAVDLRETLVNSQILLLPYRGHVAIFEEGEIIANKIISFINKL